MTTNMTVKAAHMVSKGYLRAWADEKNSVEVIDVQDVRGYRISYKGATVVSYVYDPKILNHDLEQEYAEIESNGIPVINKMRDGNYALSDAETKALVAFLDMHLDRGRYANQAKVLAPAILVKTDGQHENSELNLGDRLLLSQALPEVLRLSKLGIEEWPWHVITQPGLVTGDGAVLLWCETGSVEVNTISFPLSPTQLLVIGQPLADGTWPNLRLTQNCKRWIVGELGTLNLNFAKADGTRK
ncbi:DUF4238 domain-containing protein [Glutamicibacter ardleyensis]|uniref:DUF4238 domain-containing protein n=3 Tax=Glutamicibacter TaxID=1742989 RepID=UPI003FD204F0